LASDIAASAGNGGADGASAVAALAGAAGEVEGVGGAADGAPTVGPGGVGGLGGVVGDVAGDPAQDTGVVLGISEGAQAVSFKEMTRVQGAINEVVSQDPDVQAYAATIGAGVGGQTTNNGRIFIALKPWDQRVGGTAQNFITRIRPKLQKVMGGALFLSAAQDIRVGGRITKTEFQYTLQDADLTELYQWSPKILEKLKGLPMLRDVATDQQVAGMTVTLVIDRDQAARFGVQPQVIDDTLYDAFGQRQITQYFSQVNSYHLILEVMPNQVDDVETLNKLYVKSDTGQAVPLSTFVKWSTVPVQPLSISHQSQFPAVTISFNLAPGAALGQAVDAIDAAVRQMGVPITVQRSFQGTAQAFQSSLSTQPYLIAAALITVYIILGITAGWRDPAQRDPPGLPAALPTHHDDYDGGAAQRPAADVGPRCRLRTASSPRDRGGGRADPKPGADALHHTCDLSVPGPAAALVVAAPARYPDSG
jgi:hypothetical protein